MNRSIINLIATVLLAYIWAMLSMDWWSAALAAIITGSMYPLKGFKVFFIPFIGIFLFWSIYAYVLSSANDFRLASQIGVLFDLGEQPILVILITGLIGGLSAGVAGISGKQIANIKGKK